MSVQSIGMPVRREEDYRLLRGKGRYVDDVNLAGTAWCTFVRSPHAHAVARPDPEAPQPARRALHLFL